jgi:hypothetical protein
MGNAQTGFYEGPAGNPVDTSQTIAVIGVCSGLAPAVAGAPAASIQALPVVLAIDTPDIIFGNAGYGPAPELTNLVSRTTKNRVLFAPCAATVAAVLGAVTQVGNGPIVTVSGAPFDDASVIAKVVDAGAAGAGTVAISYTSVVTNGNAAPLYQNKITIPPRAPATITGTVDLTTLTYAKPAVQTGTIDLSTLTYGPAGTLDTKTVIATIDAGVSQTCTFAAPANAAAVVSQMVTTFGAGKASINQQNQIVLNGITLGTTGLSNITGGTALASLGLTINSKAGTAGTLDGLTLLFGDDQQASQTATFLAATPPANAAAVAAVITALVGVTATVYSAQNLLQLTSKTLGSTSTITVTGGTGRAVLGLPLLAAAGAESTYLIPHLGVTVTFGSGSNGVFSAGTTYAFPCTAGKPSDTEIQARIDDLIASNYGFVAIFVASETDLGATYTRAASMDTKVLALQATSRKNKRVNIGFKPSETDVNVRAQVAGAWRSAWVDLYARGAWVPVSSNILGGGDVLRSQMWLGAMCDSGIPYFRDRGDHGATIVVGTSGIPSCDGVTVDEALAVTKLVNPPGTPGISLNVIDFDGTAYHFAGGYSCADGMSLYSDQSVRNAVIRLADITQAALGASVNRTDLDTDSAGHLTAAAGGLVDSAVENAASNELVPAVFQNVQSQVDLTLDFYHQKKLAVTVTGFNRSPARTVTAKVGPGIVALS